MKLGKIFGVGIYVNPFFLGLIALFFVAGVLGKGLLAFAVVFIHEFVHTMVAKRMGVQVYEVELLPFGGVTKMGDDPALDPMKELCIAAAGPLSNIVLALGAIACKNYGIWHETLGPFFLQINLLIALFNVLPALPLDGGRVYRAILAGRMGLKKATYQAAFVGQIWSWLIMGVGLLGLVWGIMGLDVMITGAFLYYAATKEKMAAPYLFMKHVTRKKDELLEKGLLATDFFVALEDTVLGDLIQVFLPQKFHIIIVLDKDLRYQGIVMEKTIVESLSVYGYDLPVGKLLGQL